MKMSLVASKHRTLIALVVVLVIVAGVVSVAMAQPGPQQGEEGGGRRGGGDMRAMMMRGMMAPPIMEVSGNAVFLFRGNTLYKFDADTLELLAQTDLPMPQPPAPQ